MKLISASLFLAVISCAGMVYADGNPIKGAQLFKQCTACHTIGEGAADAVGPSLNHVFGRRAGSVEGYNYSDAMRAKGDTDGLIWTEKPIYIFLAGPQRYVPDTTMGFAGLRKEKEINDLISFLIAYSPAYTAESGDEVDSATAAATSLPPPPSSDEEEEEPDFSNDYLASAETITTGGELWGKQCRHCHGNSAYPGKAPKLKPAGYTPKFVFERVTDGFRKMPAWKAVFSLEERMALVAYVMSPRFSP